MYMPKLETLIKKKAYLRKFLGIAFVFFAAPENIDLPLDGFD